MDAFVEIGTGIYTPKDIEIILNINSRTVRNRLKGLSKNIKDKRIFYQGEKKELVTNFITMIELYIFNELRENGISIPKIYKAYEEASQILNTKYPFAHQKLLISGNKILLELENEIITLEGNRQYVLRKIIENYYKKIEFDRDDKLASAFYPLGKDKSIEVNPEVSYGEPVIKNTRINTAVILDYYKAEKNAEFVADLFEIEPEAVRDVIQFYKVA